jgi:hypothetical protein
VLNQPPHHLDVAVARDRVQSRFVRQIDIEHVGAALGEQLDGVQLAVHGGSMESSPLVLSFQMDPLVRVALPVLRWPAAERALELVVETRLGVGKPPGLPLALDIVPMLGPTLHDVDIILQHFMGFVTSEPDCGCRWSACAHGADLRRV